MLLTVARRLTRYMRPQDALARVGGDQFAILLLAETNPHQVTQLAERIRKALRGPVKIAGEDVILTSSIGCSVYSGPQCTGEDLFREAEIAMYRAKRLGTDRIELFKPEMLSDRDNRVALENDLRQAIVRGELQILYQPIMRLARSELVGFEALLCWEHPKLGTISPAEFIPIAEGNGTILELGAFVLDQASREAARWQRIVPVNEKPLFVSVNVSSGQLFREELVVDIRHILSRQSLRRGALRLEIPESIVMENPEQAIDILHTLKALGAGLSMDDFGSGYSSLSYLLRFPFDTIKVDREIVQHRNHEEAGAVILRSIVALAHELNKDVVAQGIETHDDGAYMRSIKCDYGQGLYYGEAMSSIEVQNLLKALVKSGKLVLQPTKKSSRKAPPPPIESATIVTTATVPTSAPTPVTSQQPAVAPAQVSAPTAVKPTATPQSTPQGIPRAAPGLISEKNTAHLKSG